MASDGDRYLGIYLNDHLASATAALELAKRVRGEYPGTSLGAFADELLAEMTEDRDVLRACIAAVGADPDRLKVAGGWIGEKLGRLKLNGQVRGGSPLSPVVELDALSLLLESNRVVWTVLLATQPQRFGEERLRRLAEAAERRRADVEEHRRRAAREAFL